MFWFKSTKGLLPANVPPHWIKAELWREWVCPLNVVRGESFRQATISRIAGGPKRDGCLVPVVAILFREPENSHDRHAIRVEVADQQIGYMAKELAIYVSPTLERFNIQVFSVPGLIRGGRSDDPTFGVHLWLDKRLEEGPDLVPLIERSRYQVPWPPYEEEGKY